MQRQQQDSLFFRQLGRGSLLHFSVDWAQALNATVTHFCQQSHTYSNNYMTPNSVTQCGLSIQTHKYMGAQTYSNHYSVFAFKGTYGKTRLSITNDYPGPPSYVQADIAVILSSILSEALCAFKQGNKLFLAILRNMGIKKYYPSSKRSINVSNSFLPVMNLVREKDK